MRKFRLAFAAAGASHNIAVGLALASSGDSGINSSRLHAAKLAPIGESSAIGNHRRRPRRGHASHYQGLTQPLRDMARVPAGSMSSAGCRSSPTRSREPEHPAGDRTAAVQTKAVARDMPSPIQNFDGIARICGCLPPDTDGDGGPNHYMQWVNVHFAIYTKTGTQVGVTQPGNALWAGNPNAPTCPTSNNGDPIVLYDQYAGRWFASQFVFPNFPNGPFYQCVAVSTSNDSSGTWNGYETWCP